MESVLLLGPDKAGDAIKTLPVLRALMSELPHKEFHLMASEHNHSLFDTEPSLQVHVLPKSWKRLQNEKWLNGLGFSSLFPQFDKVINLLCDASEDADRLLEAIPSREKYSCQFDANNPQLQSVIRLDLPAATPAGRRESENIALLLSQVFHLDLVPLLPSFPTAPVLLPEDESEALEKMGRKGGHWLGFCPMAGTSQRTPPIQRWEKFVKRATRDGAFEKFFLFGAPADYSRLLRLRNACERRDSVELCFPSSFRALGAYLKRLDGVVAVDSGPLHLAQSLGVRSLGILSGGDVERWFSPVSEGDVLVRRGLFQRYPSVFEMMRAFERWRSHGQQPLEA